MLCEEDGQVKNDTDDGCSDGSQNRVDSLIFSERLNEWSSEENPKKAGRESGPGGYKRAGDSRYNRVEAVWMIVGAQKADPVQRG